MLDLTTKPAEYVYDTYHPYFVDNKLKGSLRFVINCIRQNENIYTLGSNIYGNKNRAKPLFEPLDNRWIPHIFTLINQKGEFAIRKNLAEVTINNFKITAYSVVNHINDPSMHYVIYSTFRLVNIHDKKGMTLIANTMLELIEQHDYTKKLENENTTESEVFHLFKKYADS